MDYRPQSPDLSSLLYAPQSPDLSGLKQSPTVQPSPRFPGTFGQHYQPQHNRFSSASYSSHGFAGPVTSSPTSVPQFQQPQQETYNYDSQHSTDMARAMKKEAHEDEWMMDTHDSKRAHNGQQQSFGQNLPDATLGVHLKTSFPVARIKRIMQADEDIGKVAQVTPHVVSRALELFMIRLITASAQQASGGAGGKGPKKIQAQHMKRAIQGNENFDFLNEIAVKVPDAPTKTSKKQEVDSDTEDAKPRKKSTRTLGMRPRSNRMVWLLEEIVEFVAKREARRRMSRKVLEP
ncbi:hypothetical protein LTR86_004462 [Recurvomyces mirabilis]|nr:hypothetical protein LTR86_004462 [Recurvomyces mirabilis]